MDGCYRICETGRREFDGKILMAQTLIVMSMHTRTPRSYTTTVRGYGTADDALEAAKYLRERYDCVIVTETAIDEATGEAIGADLVIAQYGDLPVADVDE